MWNGKRYCIDASKEDGTLGRLVNDDHIQPNCKVKRIMVQGKPHLCLFAVKEIFPGEEITYNYGDSSWPWRSMAPGEEQSHPKLRGSEPGSEKSQEVCSGRDLMTEVRAAPSTLKDDIAPGEEQSHPKLRGSEPGSEKSQEVCSGRDLMTEVRAAPSTLKDDICHHSVTCSLVSCLDHCEDCTGPVSSLKWLGLTCKLCSRSWHKSCFFKKNQSLDVIPDEIVSDSASSDGCSSGDLYIADTAPRSDGSNSDEDVVTDTELFSDSEDLNLPHRKSGPVDSLSSQERTKTVLQPISCMEQEDKDASNSGRVGIDDDFIPDSEPCSDVDDPTTSNTQTLPRSTTESFSTETAAAPQVSSCTSKNYCYVCKTPQSKISRHLKKHEKVEPDIAEAFSFLRTQKRERGYLRSCGTKVIMNIIKK
ncbi:uncharacterized protein LOC125879377 isoform X5 [Epinephelus fuscoguttatus]|uniref:uncharacterized protein LOC125879377 isoform X4 n=1 Tax=Epinephelus fuscoguttatus TaxID=293821 RepID=UPI0020D083DD|nr:uncharacterized protein LOC125879377 isoform X4 [Epinephelus fuscoguttatus]XP_049417181.1 uncharacterized protein LOC125879377 isoform X5 [Epinephelus fuscoguttatus]